MKCGSINFAKICFVLMTEMLRVRADVAGQSEQFCSVRDTRNIFATAVHTQ